MRGWFDIEANGLLDVATKVHCLSFKRGTEKKRLAVGYAQVKKALALLDECTHIVAHNGIAYDLMVLWKLYRWKPKAKVVDTLTLSCLLHPDIPGGHSLEEWGQRVGVHKLPYEGGWDEYTPEMGEYCLGDLDPLIAIDQQFEREMAEWPKWDVAVDMEHQFAKDFAVQGWRGVLVDRPHAERVVRSIDNEMGRIALLVEPLLPMRPGTKGQLKEHTPPKLQFKKDGSISANATKWFDEVVERHPGKWQGKHDGKWHNLPTPCDDNGDMIPLKTEFPCTLADQQHIKQWLMDQGWKPTMWSYKKQPDANGKLRFVRGDDGNLVPTWPKFHDKGELCKGLDQINTEFEHVKKVVRWVVIRHRRGLVQSIIDAIRPDGTVPATGFALGTPTSRVTHSVVANIPKADPDVLLGKECRAVFIARPGRKFVGVDAAGLELRCLAHYVGTPEIIKMVVEGKKEDGTEIHTVLWKACDPLVPSRNIQKNVTYGWLYGASDKKLGQTAGHPDHTAEKVGKEIRRRMVAVIPGLDRLMKAIEKAAKRGWIEGIDGRRVAIRMKHATLNTLLQLCGSSLVKHAQCYMNAEIRRRRLDAWQVISYHDEVQLDAHPAHAEEAGRLFIEGLQIAGKKFGFRCPLDGEVKIGNNWAETH